MKLMETGFGEGISTEKRSGSFWEASPFDYFFRTRVSYWVVFVVTEPSSCDWKR